jgi:D-arabinose 1-dehydrogenase-like Zn-dependent alcohol dehydrogenase
MSTKMKAAQISKAGGDFELVERNIPEPERGQVRVKNRSVWDLPQ